MSETLHLDCRGLLCPLPVLRAAKVLRGMAAGDVLHLRADDPMAVIDVPHHCAQAGLDLVSQADDPAGGQIYIIRCHETKTPAAD